MARLRSAPSVEPAIAPTTLKRTALREKTNTTRSAKPPVYEDDGETEGLVKNAKARRGRPKKSAHNEDELVMGGGLGQSDAAQTDELQKTMEAIPSEPPMTTDDLAKGDGPPPPSSKPNRRPPWAVRKVVRNEAQSELLAGLRARMEATARGEASKPVESDNTVPSSDALPTKPVAARQSTNSASAAERSEFSLSPSPPPPGKLSSVSKDRRTSIAQPGSALRSQGTPAVESSIPALKNFKRRARQPSMLAMVQQRTAASARPSLANASKKEDSNVFDLNAEPSELEDDFAPEAESTPVHVAKAKPRTSVSAKKKSAKEKAAPANPVANAKKRKSEDVDSSSSALDALRSKRRKSAPVPELDPLLVDDEPLAAFQPSEPVHGQSSSDRQATPPLQVTSDVQVKHSSPSSTPPTEPSSRRGSLDADETVPSTEKEQGAVQRVPLNDVEPLHEHDDIPNGTMAEPASSPPAQRDPGYMSTQEVMAPPATQPSPPPQREKRQKQKAEKKSKPMSTATLQSLLPRRRQPLEPRRRKTEYDISSDDEDAALDASHLESNEDELGRRLRRQTKGTPARGKKTVIAKGKARPAKSPAAARKSSIAPTRGRNKTPAAQAKKASKTYGRATTSDKENDGYETLDEGDGSLLPETSVEMSEVAKSKELEEAKRKFAEIDDFEMEFKSMSAEDHRSSSQGWR